MSMLTPRGMGGKYRITGNKYPRMRPHRRRGRLVVLTVACATALGVAGWGTLQLIDVFTGGGGTASAAGAKSGCSTKASPSADATPRPAAVPRPDRITVNVYNATPRSGLAKKTADELKKRGFRIGEVGNASKEYDKKVAGTGVLLGPASARNTSLSVLAAQLAGAEARIDAARKGGAVDLIIGTGFKDLTSRAAADKALTALTAPRPTPSGNSKKSC